MRPTLSAACLFIFAAPMLSAGEAALTHRDIFTSGSEGYHTFRIPALITAPDGALIALARVRLGNRLTGHPL